MIFLFESVHRVIQAEGALLRDSVPYDLVPTPKEHSAECGMSIRIATPHLEAARASMNGIFKTEVNETNGESDR
jgi:hypothetical protein